MGPLRATGIRSPIHQLGATPFAWTRGGARHECALPISIARRVAVGSGTRPGTFARQSCFRPRARGGSCMAQAGCMRITRVAPVARCRRRVSPQTRRLHACVLLALRARHATPPRRRTIIAALPGAMALCSCVISTESASLPFGSDVRVPGDLRFFGGRCKLWRRHYPAREVSRSRIAIGRHEYIAPFLRENIELLSDPFFFCEWREHELGS